MLQSVAFDVERAASLLKTCYNTKNVAAGICLHREISRSEHHGNVYLNTLLIKLYGKCGRIEQAIEVFNRMPYRNVLTWNNMIAAYARARHLQEARILFNRAPECDVETWVALIVGLVYNDRFFEAKSLFEIMPEESLIASNAMLAAFAKAGDLVNANLLLQSMRVWDLFSWNTVLALYCQSGHLEKSCLMFREVGESDIVTWTTLVVAYAETGDIFQATELFERMPRHDAVVWNAMIAAYAQADLIEKARCLFETLPEKNVASWNSMMCAYTDNGQPEKAIEFFETMDTVPNRISFLAVIDACSALADLREARRIYQKIANFKEIGVENAVINMYGKCGSVGRAKMVFEGMSERNTISWTAMMMALSQSGDFSRAGECFHEMLIDGLSPNEISFIGALSSCDHEGSLSQARQLFCSMINDFGINGEVDTYVCVLDMLMRIGNSDEMVVSFEFDGCSI